MVVVVGLVENIVWQCYCRADNDERTAMVVVVLAAAMLVVVVTVPSGGGGGGSRGKRGGRRSSRRSRAAPLPSRACVGASHGGCSECQGAGALSWLLTIPAAATAAPNNIVPSSPFLDVLILSSSSCFVLFFIYFSLHFQSNLHRLSFFS